MSGKGKFTPEVETRQVSLGEFADVLSLATAVEWLVQ